MDTFEGMKVSQDEREIGKFEPLRKRNPQILSMMVGAQADSNR